MHRKRPRRIKRKRMRKVETDSYGQEVTGIGEHGLLELFEKYSHLFRRIPG